MAMRKDGKKSKAQKHKEASESYREKAAKKLKGRKPPRAIEVDCANLNKQGKPCGMPVLKDPDPEDGLYRCFQHHSSITTEQRRKVASQGGKANASRYPKPHELLRRIVEARPDAFIRPHLEALGLEIEIKDSEDPERPGEVDIEIHEVGDGAVLFGVSKEGDVVISRHKDLESQQRAAERLFDRVYGKPKQADKVYAGQEDPAPPEIMVYDDNRQAEVAEILAKSGVQASAPPPPADLVGNGSNNGHSEE